MKGDFKYKSGQLQLTTVNQQYTFYYRLTKLIDNWGNLSSKIAFFGRDNKIVYHRKDCFAHILKDAEPPDFVKWSKNGDAAVFFEYKPGHADAGGVYHYLLLDLEKSIVFRLNLYKYDHSFIDVLKNYDFYKDEIINKFSSLGIEKEQCFTDEVIISPVKWLTGVDRWKPNDKL